jgi:hypothetical protein
MRNARKDKEEEGAHQTPTSRWAPGMMPSSSIRSMEGRRAQGLIRMVAPASKLPEREREEASWVRERSQREREEGDEDSRRI